MANEANKDFNAMLREARDMPRIQIVTDEKTIAKYGGSRMFFAPPAQYDAIMKRVLSSPCSYAFVGKSAQKLGEEME